MFNEFTSFVSALWVIFSFSFLVALTGAMSPGPLLTYTIIKAAKTSKRGYLMGLWIIAVFPEKPVCLPSARILKYGIVLQLDNL
jgi:hypothetical protein